MRIALMALSGVRVHNEALIEAGVTLPQFVSRGKVIAQLPSLSLLTLAALTPKDIMVDYVEVPNVDELTNLDTGYDLVAITTYSAQAFEAYQLADRYRAAGVPVIIGGPHVSALPEEASEHADSVAIGEGELLWPQIIDDLKSASLQAVYREPDPGKVDLLRSPLPSFHLLDPDQYNRITVQTSRGCPHDCEFCAGSKLFGTGFRQKPVAAIVRELEAICERWPQPFIEFADDNTFVDKRWSRDFLEAIQPLGLRWFTETDISVADDDDLLELMYLSGCYQLLIGFESSNEASLEDIDRHNWKKQRQPQYRDAITRIQASGISVNGCFIVGLDQDTSAIFEELRDFIISSELLEAQVTVLTPYPGTALYQRLKRENRLLYERPWDRCTMFDLCFEPQNMTALELERGLAWLYSEIYSEPLQLHRKRHYMDLIKKLPRRTR